MRNIAILDCTLRDGGRIIDCRFNDQTIGLIINKLTKANVDTIEIGFLRDARDVKYIGNSTFFTDVEQIVPFIPKNRENSEYAAFIDYGMFDFDTLKPFDGRSIDCIRLGFTKNDYLNHYDDLIRAFKKVKKAGYKLYIQGVNSLNYTDSELLNIVDMVNEIKPYSFGIVDTYGAMYVDDVTRLYGLIDHNLNEDIAIDFHSHNNFQLSFSFAQQVVKLSGTVRKIVLDSTLSGMGKGAGNLNTELIADFLVRKMAYNYDIDRLFDIIDEHLYDLWQEYHWGYSLASLMSGIYRSHPNNVIYLAKKFRLNSKDIKNILSTMSADERQGYNYDSLNNRIENYKTKKYNDESEIEQLSLKFNNRSVLVLAPGATLNTHAKIIDDFIHINSPIIISVNFISGYANAYAFYSHAKRYNNLNDNENVIVTSDIARYTPNETVVSYHSLIIHGSKAFENSTIMLLNLLKRLRVKKIAIAGMDGYSNIENNNYFDSELKIPRLSDVSELSNVEIFETLKKYVEMSKGVCDVSLLTPSKFEKVFAND